MFVRNAKNSINHVVLAFAVGLYRSTSYGFSIYHGSRMQMRFWLSTNGSISLTYVS